jgi:hypothetical protein
VRPPTIEEAPDELDTMRLPSIKTVIAESLARALAASSCRELVILGEILAGCDTGAMIGGIRRLVDAEADLRFIEAAVRAIESAEGAGKVEYPIDFPVLCLNDGADAAVVVFHPHSPTYLLNQAFIIAFENHVGASLPGGVAGGPWKGLAKAAAVVLHRRDSGLLEEDVCVMSCGGDGWKARLLRQLVEWSARKDRPPAAPPAEPLESALAAIAGPDAASSVEAAVRVLLTYGFIGVSAQLD